MYTVGYIDVEKYKMVSKHIQTAQVIITEERIRHIQERNPEDYERYAEYLKEIVEDPDYILKEVQAADEKFQLILRLSVAGDTPEYKNSVITFLKIDQKRFQRYLRTKKILYKSE